MHAGMHVLTVISSAHWRGRWGILQMLITISFCILEEIAELVLQSFEQIVIE